MAMWGRRRPRQPEEPALDITALMIRVYNPILQRSVWCDLGNTRFAPETFQAIRDGKVNTTVTARLNNDVSLEFTFSKDGQYWGKYKTVIDDGEISPEVIEELAHALRTDVSGSDLASAKSAITAQLTLANIPALHTPPKKLPEPDLGTVAVASKPKSAIRDTNIRSLSSVAVNYISATSGVLLMTGSLLNNSPVTGVVGAGLAFFGRKFLGRTVRRRNLRRLERERVGPEVEASERGAFPIVYSSGSPIAPSRAVRRRTDPPTPGGFSGLVPFIALGPPDHPNASNRSRSVN